MNAKDNNPTMPGSLKTTPHRKPVPKRKAPASWDTVPHTFLALTVVAAAAYTWPRRWIISGAPSLFYCLLLGESHGERILSSIPLWTIFTSMHFLYAIASTSWLLYWVFAFLCYPCILLCCLYQFDYSAGLARRALRKVLKHLHFFNDKVAFFNLPAMEFDTETKGLMVIRGATLSLSTLTLVAHGIEVGIRLSDDMELAFKVDKVTVWLFRRIEIDDLYLNVKGGEWEMTFGTLPPHEGPEVDVETLLVRDTQIMRAATMAIEGSAPIPIKSKTRTNTMEEAGAPQEVSNMDDILDAVEQLSPDEESANKRYYELLREIEATSTINTTREALREALASDTESEDEDHSKLDLDNINDLRAAIAAQIQDLPSINHLPTQSIRLSTIKHNNHPKIQRFIRRFPLLYRMLLNPIAYLHPITIKSVTAAGSGKWFKLLMDQYFFKHYVTQDQDVRRLENRISSWLGDANFAVELADIKATAQVPVNLNFDIENHFKIADVMAYRILPGAIDLTQVVRIGGADATISVPIFLFPHHEHIFPAPPNPDDIADLERQIEEWGEAPQSVQAKSQLKRLKKDEANCKISAHAHLPAKFHQDLLNFIAALVKASKVIETDKDFEEQKQLRDLRRSSTMPSSDSLDNFKENANGVGNGATGLASSAASIASTASAASSTFSNDTDITPGPAAQEKNPKLKSFFRKMDTGFKEAGLNMRDGMRKAGLNTASAMANDRWIAKLVGKAVRKLEKAQGEVGYSGFIPVPLEKYRGKFEDEGKILP